MTGRILINSRFLNRPLSGVERYAAELTRYLPHEFTAISPGPGAGRAGGVLWEQLRLPTLLESNDLLWSPANVGPLATRNQVLTVHDLSPIEHPEWFVPAFSLWYRFLLPRLIRRVRHVITDSDFTKQRIRTLIGIPETQISVVPCGVNPLVFTPVNAGEQQKAAQLLALPDRYFLALGTTEPRKNIRTLLKAWRCAKLYQDGVRLILAGGEQPLFRSEPAPPIRAPGVRRIGRVTDFELRTLYSGALALVYPSLYEGFGLPLLEAMACGAPVAASTAGALPELLGEAGLAFAPTDFRGLAGLLRRLSSNKDLNAELKTRSLERAAQFSWETTRARVFEILRREVRSV